MRTASLILVALFSSHAFGGFWLDVSPYLPAAVDNRALIGNRAGSDATVAALDSARSDELEPFMTAALLGDEELDTNLPAQFERIFKLPVRELRAARDTWQPRSSEEIAYQLAFVALVTGLWLVRFRQRPQTHLARVQKLLGQLRAELKACDHTEQALVSLQQQLVQFCASIKLPLDLPEATRSTIDLATEKLITQIAIRLPQHPLRPSGYTAAVQQFTMLLELLHNARLTEHYKVRYHKRGA